MHLGQSCVGIQTGQHPPETTSQKFKDSGLHRNESVLGKQGIGY